MSKEQLKELIYTHASDCARKGGGWSQESVVLREVSDRVTKENGKDIVLQRIILDAWHDLFTEKRLGWGYDLDNPNSPFFHVRG